MKKLLLLLPLWLLATSAFAADEMLSNPGFEDSSSNFLFGTTFDEWSTTGITLDVETTDKVEGEQALKVKKATFYKLIFKSFSASATATLLLSIC